MPIKSKRHMKHANVAALTDICNVGPSIASDLELIGVKTPQGLKGRDPVKLYECLIKKSGKFQDPCVLDVFMAAIDFMNGNPPQVWWAYTSQRKKLHTATVNKWRAKYSR